MEIAKQKIITTPLPLAHVDIFSKQTNRKKKMKYRNRKSNNDNNNNKKP